MGRHASPSAVEAPTTGSIPLVPSSARRPTAPGTGPIPVIESAHPVTDPRLFDAPLSPRPASARPTSASRPSVTPTSTPAVSRPAARRPAAQHPAARPPAAPAQHPAARPPAAPAQRPAAPVPGAQRTAASGMPAQRPAPRPSVRRPPAPVPGAQPPAASGLPAPQPARTAAAPIRPANRALPLRSVAPQQVVARETGIRTFAPQVQPQVQPQPTYPPVAAPSRYLATPQPQIVPRYQAPDLVTGPQRVLITGPQPVIEEEFDAVLEHLEEEPSSILSSRSVKLAACAVAVLGVVSGAALFAQSQSAGAHADDRTSTAPISATSHGTASATSGATGGRHAAR
jgi:hypothetical protein